MLRSIFLVFIYLYVLVGEAQGACHNDCHRKGHCTVWGTCECFKGFEGNDCSRKSCPLGHPLADIANGTDSAHTPVPCSAQGTCDYTTGTCKCNAGYSGKACSSTSCFNDCSGRGQCVSLRAAAELNDGYLFNRTTTYNQWDADVIFGCKCDPGFSGADCSQRSCEYAPDPRLDVKPREKVTLVCDCQGKQDCRGKFKLRFLGTVMKSWLYPTSRAFEVANAIMTTPGIFGNNSAHSVPPVKAANNSVDNYICEKGRVTRTVIDFKRNQGDLPALSFYANLFNIGSIYFETTQHLVCDCVNHPFQGCSGSFRVSFDGEMSAKLNSASDTIADVATALSSMKTIQAASITVTSSGSGSICAPGELRNHTLLFTAQMGNVPLVELWSSVVTSTNPSVYTTSNTSNVLRITSSDGRDDNLKLCNGIGKCDFSTGQCHCPFGWEFNADLGPCGQLQVNTSRYAGLARCPGVAIRSSPLNDLSGSRNYQTVMYLSLNPLYKKKENKGTATFPNNRTLSGIFSFAWRPDTITGPDIDESTQQLFLNLSSNSSAGPLLIDATKDRMFFLDNHPTFPFIGIAPLRGSPGTSTVWLYVSYRIFAMASDAHFKRRNLYWSVPGTYHDARGDGGIYYANMDESSPTVHSLASVIGQTYVVDPHGIAIHYKQQRIYWTDRNVTVSGQKHGVLRSCDLDGGNVKTVFVYRTVDNVTVSTNITDLVIDFRHNNTAFMLDAGEEPAVIATALDFPPNYNNDTEVYDAWLGMYPTRAVVTARQITMGSPQYIFLDDQNNLVLWSDPVENEVAYQRYIKEPFDLFSPGVAFVPDYDPKRSGIREYYPVGMVIDIGLGPPLWDELIECYGNGQCPGLDGNFVCECVRGYFGDCLSRTCPLGRAWFHEPAVDEVAHDVFMECSNMGVCDRRSGQCTCRSGYEGNACERLSCPGRISTSSDCNGRGRCISMRNLALKHVNEYQTPTPVVYGSKASDPVTWDADMVYGCYPDQYGYKDGDYRITTPSGADLTQYECPVGYNVRLLDEVYRNASTGLLQSNYTSQREIQRIRCNADYGYFTLSFRGQETQPIYANTSAVQLVKLLQALRTVGKVEVYFDEYSDRLCTTLYPQYAQVVFITQLGKVPLLEVQQSTLSGRPGTVTIDRMQAGTTDGLQECAGKGDCDFRNGMCRCWDHYGTSNGIGGPGDSGDCGNYIV